MIQTINQITDERREAYQPNSRESLPYIGLEHIEGGSLKLNSIGKSDKVSSQKKKFYKGDILYGSLRPYFRKVVLAGFDGVSSTDITILKPKKQTNTKFLFYLIAGKNFIDRATMASNGTKMPRAGWKVIKDFNFDVPEKNDQEKVGSLLSTYDELIENNVKRIKILEEMAQRLYTEWFVKFKFPGHETMKMVESPRGKIPEGWEVVTIEDLLDQIKRKPKIQATEYLDDGLFPIVDQGREFIAGYTENQESIYNEDLIVFGDHTRVLKYCNFPFACGADGTQLLKSNDMARMPQILLYYIAINAGLQNYQYARHFKFLKALKVLKPDSKIAHNFESIVASQYKFILKLNFQNKNLVDIRDLLIPQLVTGRRELKV